MKNGKIMLTAAVCAVILAAASCGQNKPAETSAATSAAASTTASSEAAAAAEAPETAAATAETTTAETTTADNDDVTEEEAEEEIEEGDEDAEETEEGDTEVPESEEHEPAHPFQYTDTGWEMENVPETLMDMNAVAGRNNAFMLQLDRTVAKDGFEVNFIFLDSQGLIIADYKVTADTVEDLGIAPAPMLSGYDIVVYPVMLRDILDTYPINLQDVAEFYITDNFEAPCVQLVTIEQY